MKTIKELQKELRQQKKLVKNLRLHVVQKTEYTNTLYNQIGLLKEQLKEKLERPDPNLIESRIKIANSLNGLVESVSKAIIYTIGKEQL